MYSFNINQNKIIISRIQVSGLLTTEMKGQSLQRGLIANIKSFGRLTASGPPTRHSCTCATDEPRGDFRESTTFRVPVLIHRFLYKVCLPPVTIQGV